MKNVHLKVVFNPSLEDKVRPALPALQERFRPFELNVEGCMPGGTNQHRIRGGLLVLRAADAADTVDLDSLRTFGRTSYHFMATQDFAVGLTPHPILMQYPERRLIIPEAFEYYKASVISLATIRADCRRAPRVPDVEDADSPRFIGLALSHAIGHVMIREQKLDSRGYCASAGCIMGRITAILDLMSLPRDADFCPSCKEGIGDTVRAAQWYAMA